MIYVLHVLAKHRQEAVMLCCPNQNYMDRERCRHGKREVIWTAVESEELD